MEWRKKWKTDTLFQDYKVPEVLKKYYPGGLAGYDKEGCPVWMVQSANFDMKGKLHISTPGIPCMKNEPS